MYLCHKPISVVMNTNQKAIDLLKKGDYESSLNLLTKLESIISKAIASLKSTLSIKYKALNKSSKAKITNLDLLKANIFNSIGCVYLKLSYH